ncbi:MAG: hypothetical protein L6R48_12890 [Planctomycetes bacterium]|nr:hypothetical protein [Planctomycetota bacterium]
MNHPLRSLGLVTAALVLCTGCGPRAKPTVYQLEVEPYDVEVPVPVNVPFTGYVTLDGVRTDLGALTTPWQGKWTAIDFGGELRTLDVNGFRATLTFEEPPVPALTVRNRAKGADGALLRVVQRRTSSTQGVHIQAMQLPPAGAMATAAAVVPAPAASAPATAAAATTVPATAASASAASGK